jgi:hypothetical protein
MRFMITSARVAVLVLCLIGTLAALAGGGGARVNPSAFSKAQWESTFATAAAAPLSARVALWADLAAVDADYVADPLGEGPGAAPDADPLCDYGRVDCVTFVEQVYALALSPTRAAVDDTLRRIRYRDGQVDFRRRNHYTVSDWLPANAWFIRDVTDTVGAGLTQTMSKTISRKAFFAAKGLTVDVPDETAGTSYIPRDAVARVLPALRTGDLLIFVIDTPGIIAGHVGLTRVQGGAVSLQHASLARKAVVTVPLLDYLADAPARFVGIKVARPFVGQGQNDKGQ